MSSLEEAIADAVVLYDDISKSSTAEGLVQGFDGDILPPAIYGHNAAWALAAGRTITFEGSATDTWYISIAGATSIGGNIKLSPDVSALNIFWAVGGAFDLSAENTFYGTLVTPAAIAIGASAQMNGRILSLNGAIAIGASAVVDGGLWQTAAVMSRGALSLGQFGKLGGNSVVGGAFSGAANSVVNGGIDAVGVVSVGAEASVNGDVLTQAAMTLGAKSIMNGNSQAKGAAVVGAGASVTGDFRAASVTVGNSGTISGNVFGELVLEEGAKLSGDVIVTYNVSESGEKRFTGPCDGIVQIIGSETDTILTQQYHRRNIIEYGSFRTSTLRVRRVGPRRMYE
jgi:cytoskeletal protein CcmA (bactofilin family)